jgi:hypothetical protein
LTNTENGLALRRWTVIDQPGRIITALAKHADGQAADEPTLARLQRNGFRLVRLPLDELEQTLAEMGGATVDANEWHGQAPQWRAIGARSVESSGRAVAIDGRVRRFDRGDFRLIMRSWTVQMETGPAVHLEMVPQHVRPQANNLRRLLGEQQQESAEGFGGAAIDLQLEDGFAYALLGESPGTDWKAEAAEAGRNKGMVIPKSVSGGARVAGKGPDDATGPEATMPLTLGELLLAGGDSAVGAGAMRTRSVIVLVPKIAAELFPADQIRTAGK